jgi:hypothetical protein
VLKENNAENYPDVANDVRGDKVNGKNQGRDAVDKDRCYIVVD